jgi:hypothetical protein
MNNYPLNAPINWYLTSSTNLEARDRNNIEFPQEKPLDVETLIKNGTAQVFNVQLAYRQTAVAGTCCLYQKMGNIWLCVKTC